MKFRFSLFVLAALCVCASAFAQNSTWTGLGLTDIEWSDNLNWDTPPTTSSNVYFSNITPVISDIDSNTTIANLYIEGTVLGTLNLTSTGGFTLNSAIYYESALSATISVAVVNPSGTIYANGGTLTLANGSNMLGGLTVLGGTVTDSVAGAYSTTGGIQIDGPGVVLVNFNESAGYLADYSAGGGSVVLASGVTLTLANGFSTTFSGVVSGPGGIEKGSIGTMTLTGANTYTGTTVIDAGGGIQLGNNGTTGSLSASTIVSGGGSLGFYLTGTPAPVQEAITGGIQVVLHSGSGTVKLSGANTYSGGTVVNGGTLQAGSTSAFGGTANSIATIASGGTLDLNGFSNTTGGISGAGNVLLTGSGTNLTIAGSNAEIFTGAVTGLGGLVMDGYSQYLSGNSNTYSGNTTINAGSLVADNTLGTASATGTGFISIGASGTLQIGSGDGKGYVSGAITDNGKVSFFRSDTNTFANNINGTGGIEMAGFATQVLSGSNGYSGETEMFRGTLQAGVGDTGAFGNDSAFVFDGVGSTLDLNNNNELVGSVSGGGSSDHITLGSGNLSLNNTSAVTTFGGDISGSGDLTTRQAQLTLTGSNTFSGGINLAEGTLVLGNNSAAGSGTINLASSTSLNLATGVTATNALNFTGTAAVLTGSGTIASPVTVNSAAVIAPTASPGGGPGTLTFSGGLTLASGGSINFNLYDATGVAGTGYNLVSSTGPLNLTASAGSFTVNIASVNSTGGAAAAMNFNAGSPYSWTLVSSGATTGFNANQFSFVDTNFQNSIGAGSFSVSESANDLILNFTPVPEPSTWCLIGAGVLAIIPFALRRRSMARV